MEQVSFVELEKLLNSGAVAQEKMLAEWLDSQKIKGHPAYKHVYLYNYVDCNPWKLIYLASGTLITTKDSRQYVLTAKHVVTYSFNLPIIAVVPDEDVASNPIFLDREVIEYHNMDAVVYSTSTELNTIESLSDHPVVYEKMITFRSEVHIRFAPRRKEVLSQVVSVNSKKSYRPIGIAEKENVITGERTHFIIIEKESIKGESGSSFFDSHGNMYILHGSLNHIGNSMEKITAFDEDSAQNEHIRSLEGKYTLLTGPIYLGRPIMVKPLSRK